MQYVLWIILGTITLVVLWQMNRGRRFFLNQAHHAFDRVSQTAGRELELVSQTLERAEETVGTGASNSSLTGASLRAGQQITNQVDQLKSLSGELQRVLGEGDHLLYPVGPLAQAANMINSSRYVHCLNLVNGRPLQIDSEWLSFSDFFRRLVAKRERVNSLIDNFSGDLNGVGGLVDSLQSGIDKIAEAEQKLENVSGDSRLFRLPSLFNKLLPRLENQAEQLVEAAAIDPISVKTDQLPAFTQKLDDVLRVTKSVQNAHAKYLPKLQEAKEELKQQGYSDRWIDRQLRDLSKEADRLVETAMTHSITEQAIDLENQLIEFSAKTTKAQSLALELNDTVVPSVDQIETLITTARQSIADRLKLSTALVLRESEYSPDDELQRAKQQITSAQAALNRGDANSVVAAFDEVEVETSEAQRFVEDSLAALADFDVILSRQNEKLSELDQRLPSMNQAVASMESKYDSGALTVAGTADLLDHNSSNNTDATVRQLYDSVVQWLRQNESTLNESSRMFKSGKILQACNQIDLLAMDLEHTKQVAHLIDDHSDHLVQVQSDNLAKWNQLQQTFEATQQQLSKSMKFIQASELAEELELKFGKFNLNSHAAGKSNPLANQSMLESFQEGVMGLRAILQTHDESYHQVKAAIAGSEAELRVAKQLVKNSHSDNIPDSQQITADQNQVDLLEKAIEKVKADVKNHPLDLEPFDREATRIQAELCLVNGRLRDELQLAKRAAETLKTAAAQVFNAANWQGPYNIVVVGRPGTDELTSARRALHEGKYSQAISRSQNAAREAQNAIRAAEAQVARHRRNIARQARERRNRWDRS